MNASQEFLNQIQVASPCSAEWAKMSGDERIRHCNLCQKNVYNLSSMTAKAAQALIKEKEGKLCVKFYRRSDGAILTSDCPIGLKEHAKRLWWRVATLSASFMAWIFLVGCKSKTNNHPEPGRNISLQGDVSIKHIPATLGEPAIMGKVAVQPKIQETRGEITCFPNIKESTQNK